MKLLTKLFPLLFLVTRVAAADIWSAPSGWSKSVEGAIAFETPNKVFGNWTQESSGIAVLMFSLPQMADDTAIRYGAAGFVSGVLRSGHYPESINYINIRDVSALKIEGLYVGSTAEYWQDAYIFIGKGGSYAVKVTKPSKQTNFNIEDWVIPVGALPEAEARLKLLQIQLSGDALKDLQESIAKLQAITRKTRTELKSGK